MLSAETELKDIIAVFDRDYTDDNVPDMNAPFESVLLQNMPIEWRGALLLDSLFYLLGRFMYIKVNTEYKNDFQYEDTDYLNYIGQQMGILTDEKKLQTVTNVKKHLANPSKNIEGLADWFGFESIDYPSELKKRIKKSKALKTYIDNLHFIMDQVACMISCQVIDVIKAVYFLCEANKIFEMYMASDLYTGTRTNKIHLNSTRNFGSSLQASADNSNEGINEYDSFDSYSPDYMDGNLEMEFCSLFLWFKFGNSKPVSCGDEELEIRRYMYKYGRRIVHFEWLKIYQIYVQSDMSISSAPFWEALAESKAIKAFVRSVSSTLQTFIACMQNQIPSDNEGYLSYLQVREGITRENSWSKIWKQTDGRMEELNPFIKFEFRERKELDTKKNKRYGCPLKIFSGSKADFQNGMSLIIKNINDIELNFLHELFEMWGNGIETNDNCNGKAKFSEDELNDIKIILSNVNAIFMVPIHPIQSWRKFFKKICLLSSGKNEDIIRLGFSNYCTNNSRCKTECYKDFILQIRNIRLAELEKELKKYFSCSIIGAEPRFISFPNHNKHELK